MKENMVSFSSEFHFVLYHYRLNTDPEAGTPEPDDTIADITAQEDTESVVAVDLMSSAADFCPKGPKSALQFGLRELLVLSPGGDDTLGKLNFKAQIMDCDFVLCCRK